MKTQPWYLVLANHTNLKRPRHYLQDDRLKRLCLGKHEVEESVRLLVKFFDQRDSWGHFTMEELSHFCQSQPESKSAGHALFGLICPWLDNTQTGGWMSPYPHVVQVDEKVFGITSQFIAMLDKTEPS